MLAGVALGLFVFIRSSSYVKKIIFGTSLIVLSVNYYLNRDFYPALLTYQAESEAAYYMKDNNIDAKDVVFVGEMESVADVIMQQPTKVVSIEDVTSNDVEILRKKKQIKKIQLPVYCIFGRRTRAFRLKILYGKCYNTAVLSELYD